MYKMLKEKQRTALLIGEWDRILFVERGERHVLCVREKKRGMHPSIRRGCKGSECKS